ncbi:MAG: PIN domain-containing protein [Amaricoccus sp.]
MKVLLDACVLVPSVLRAMLLATADAGGFAPLWSARILEEWARATRRLPGDAEAEARGEIARLAAAWPEAMVPEDADLEASLSLPDPGDRHVLAAAITGGAGTLVTLNRADFPTRTLARHGILLREPDGFLVELDASLGLGPVATAVRARAEWLAGRSLALRPLLRRAGLPRLGEALAAREAVTLPGS